MQVQGQYCLIFIDLEIQRLVGVVVSATEKFSLGAEE